MRPTTAWAMAPSRGDSRARIANKCATCSGVGWTGGGALRGPSVCAGSAGITSVLVGALGAAPSGVGLSLTTVEVVELAPAAAAGAGGAVVVEAVERGEAAGSDSLGPAATPPGVT